MAKSNTGILLAAGAAAAGLFFLTREHKAAAAPAPAGAPPVPPMPQQVPTPPIAPVPTPITPAAPATPGVPTFVSPFTSILSNLMQQATAPTGPTVTPTPAPAGGYYAPDGTPLVPPYPGAVWVTNPPDAQGFNDPNWTDPNGNMPYTLCSGDVPYLLANYYTGDPKRFRELEPINPKLGQLTPMQGAKGVITSYPGWVPGAIIWIPAAWNPTAKKTPPCGYAGT